MIEISLPTALMIYLCMTLSCLLGIWGCQHYFRRKQKINIEEQQLNVCEYCKFCYLEDNLKSVSRCPQCHSFNRI